MKPLRILAFAGSTRQGSWNKKLLRIAVQAATSLGAQVTVIDLRDYPLPLFDQDLEQEKGLPSNGRKLKDLFLAHDAFLIASPEYNSSITGVLKNTIDWVSRPAAGEKPLACFSEKTAALISASPGGFGGMRSLIILRSLLGNIGVLVLPGQFALPKAHEAFNENEGLKDPTQISALTQVVKSFVESSAKLIGDRS